MSDTAKSAPAKDGTEVRASAPKADAYVLQAAPAAGVVLLTLNRPQARNSLSRGMIAALSDALAQLAADRSAHAIVIAGAGPAFCAGHDLKELTAHRTDPDKGRSFYDETMRECAALMQAIVRQPQPVIAAIEGVATAAGCQLVASCDLAIASETARFATPGVNIGLFCSTPMVALSRNVARKRAMEMLLLGDMLSAKEAADYGLVNRAVAPGAAAAGAIEWAAKIASKSPATVAVGKEAFYRQIEAPLAEAYDGAARVMVENMLYRDADEGIRAFLEKREPAWKGC